MATIAEQLPNLLLVDNLNRNSPEEPIAAPWEKPSFPTEIGYLESGWGYYPHAGGVVCSALYGAVKIPTGRGYAISTEIRQNTTSVTGSPYWELWLFLAKGAKTGIRAAAYQEGTEEANKQKYKIVLEKWVGGVKESLAEATGVVIKGVSTTVGGCLSLAYINGSAYIFTREETSAAFVQRCKAATSIPAGEYAGIGAQAATGVSYFPAVMNFRMGEIEIPVAEQLTSLAITNTLKAASLPAAFTKLPWANSTGSWSETLGWSPESYLLTANPSSRSGLYYNIEKLKGGNAVVGFKKTSGAINNEDRRGGLWLFTEAGAKASGYQLQWVTINKTTAVKLQLRKWVEGVETKLGEAAEVTLNEGDWIYLVVSAGKVSMWRRTGEGAAEMIGSEVADNTFTEGYSGFDGNGSNPRMLNFTTGVISPERSYKESVLATPGLVACWPLNETSGTTATDLKAVKNGTYNNSPLLGQPSLLPGGEALSTKFNGTNHYVSIPDAAALRVGDIFTLEAWVKPEKAEGTAQVVFGTGTGGAALWIDEENRLALVKTQITRLVKSTIKMTTGLKYHVAITKTGATVKLYINGEDVTGTVTNSTLEAIAEGWNIARELSGFNSGYTQGSVQFVALYNIPLSAAVIKQHYEAGFSVPGEYIAELGGTSVSSFSETDEFTRTEVLAGTSVSTFEEVDVFTREELVAGTSSSTGEDTMEFSEFIAMTLNGESTSSGSQTESNEASESMSGSSSSSGEEGDEYTRSESMSGSSSSTGSEEDNTTFDQMMAGTSVSSFSETDEASSTDSPAGTSASSGSQADISEASEAVAGASSSTGKEEQEFQILQPEQPVPSLVKPRRRLSAVRWKFFLCDSTTMELLGEIKQARGKNLQLALDKPGGCGFNVPIDYDLFKDVEEINHGIIAYRGDTPRYSGMIWNLDENTDGNSIQVQSVGWFETLNHRILRENVGYPPFSTGVVNAGQIIFLPASGSVGTTSYHPGGLLTIANAQRDTWLVEGVNKDVMQRIVSYQRGQNIGQAFSQLTEVEAGFDFTVDPLTRVLDIYNWNEVPDKTEEVVFGFNWGNNNIERLGRQFDPSVMANRVTALGKYGGGFAEDIESQEKYQLFEEMPQLNDVVDPNVLLGYAGGEVLLRNRPRILYSFQPFPYSGNKKVPQPFDDYDIGDKISFTAVKPPRIDIRGQAVRVYGMNIDITDEGNEKVTALQISP